MEFIPILLIKIKMIPQPAVILDIVCNDVENLNTNMIVGFEKREKIFTVIRIYPHTVMQMYETDLLKRYAKQFTHPLSFFPDIETDDSPLPIPLCRSRKFILHALNFRQSLLPFLSQDDEITLVLLYQTRSLQALNRTANGGAFTVSWLNPTKLLKDLKYVWCNQCHS